MGNWKMRVASIIVTAYVRSDNVHFFKSDLERVIRHRRWAGPPDVKAEYNGFDAFALKQDDRDGEVLVHCRAGFSIREDISPVVRRHFEEYALEVAAEFQARHFGSTFEVAFPIAASP